MPVRVPSCPQLVQPPISPNHSVNPRDCARAEIAPRPALSPCRLWPSQDAGVQCVVEPSGGSGGQKWATARAGRGHNVRAVGHLTECVGLDFF